MYSQIKKFNISTSRISLFGILATIVLFFSINMLFLLSSCTKREKVASDKDLYTKAILFKNKKQFRKASVLFERLKEEHPESQLMSKTRLNNADCFFKLKDFTSARSEYETFLNFHPSDPNANFAHYRIAMTYYNQILGADRDQTFTLKALEGFEIFLKKGSKSQLISEAQKKISLCHLRLMEHDLYIAKFYLKTNNPKASRIRLQKLWQLYPELSKKEETLFLLFHSYRLNGMSDEAHYVLSFFSKEFPNSSYLKGL